MSNVVRTVREDGPLASRSIETSEKVTGYWDLDQPKTKATTFALELLWEGGELMISHRDGNEKFYDLPSRLVPADLQTRYLDPFESQEIICDAYLRAYRLFDAGDSRFGWISMPAQERRARIDRAVGEGTILPLEIEGVRRTYYVRTEDEESLEAFSDRSLEIKDRVSLLSPLDNLLWRRSRISDLFDFDYTWEIYIPKVKRRYGPYVMPILREDRFVGRFSPRLDRDAGRLRVERVWMEPGERFADPIAEELMTLANWLGAPDLEIDQVL